MNPPNPQGSTMFLMVSSSLVDLDLTGLVTTNVTDMSYMFDCCTQLRTITFDAGFDTSNAVNMSRMFNECYELPSIDLSFFNTEKVTDMTFMFN